MKRNAWLAILVGGGLAGLFDILMATYDFGWRVPRAIAGGLMGPAVFEDDSWGVWSLGLFLHFFITCAAAAVYYAASRRLDFLRTHALVCGLSFGIAVWLVMNLVVLPLSALHMVDAIPRAHIAKGVLVHMFLVGLPIAVSVKRLAPS